MQFEKSDALAPMDEDDSDVEDEENEYENGNEDVEEESEGELSDGEYVASDDAEENGEDSLYYSSFEVSARVSILS